MDATPAGPRAVDLSTLQEEFVQDLGILPCLQHPPFCPKGADRRQRGVKADFARTALCHAAGPFASVEELTAAIVLLISPSFSRILGGRLGRKLLREYRNGCHASPSFSGQHPPRLVCPLALRAFRPPPGVYLYQHTRSKAGGPTAASTAWRLSGRTARRPRAASDVSACRSRYTGKASSPLYRSAGRVCAFALPAGFLLTSAFRVITLSAGAQVPCPVGGPQR